MKKMILISTVSRRSLTTGLFALALLLGPHFTFADDETHQEHEAEDDEADYDDALKALRTGDVLPLSSIKKTIENGWPGEIVKIEVKRRKGGLHYEFKVLRPNGHLTEIEVDASNGKVVEVENE